MSLGTLIRRARGDAGKTLATVATALDVSVPYLCDVEYDRRDLAPKRWPALVAALPALSLRALAVAKVSSGIVEIDACHLTKAQRDRLARELLAKVTA